MLIRLFQVREPNPHHGIAVREKPARAIEGGVAVTSTEPRSTKYQDHEGLTPTLGRTNHWGRPTAVAHSHGPFLFPLAFLPREG